MKIAYITSFFPPDRVAGAELGTHFMARHMAQSGHEVHVIITRPKDPVYRTESREGYTIHWMHYLPYPGVRLLSEVRAGIQLLKQLKPDMVHGNCLLPGGLIASLYGKRSFAPSVALCYGYDVCDMSFLQAIFGRFALRSATIPLAATQYCSTIMKRWVPSLTPTVFYAGCNEKVFPLQPLRSSSPPYSLLFIGRMIPEKGFDLLLDIMQKLPLHYHMTVVGKGQQEQEFKEQCAINKNLVNRIVFKGEVNNEDLKHTFATTDCLVLPSKREPFGVVCIESICSGVPVVCSNVMGLPEAVTDGRNGSVLSSRDPGEWAETIRQTVENNLIRQRIHRAAQEDRSRWAWSTRLIELENIYHRLLRKKESAKAMAETCAVKK